MLRGAIFARVRYDDSDHSYMGDGFPWYRLRSLIAEKLDARGIALEASAFHRRRKRLGRSRRKNPYDFRFCATDKRSAINGGNACRPDRPRKAVKRLGYTGFVPDRPGSDNLMG